MTDNAGTIQALLDLATGDPDDLLDRCLESARQVSGARVAAVVTGSSSRPVVAGIAGDRDALGLGPDEISIRAANLLGAPEKPDARGKVNDAGAAAPGTALGTDWMVLTALPAPPRHPGGILAVGGDAGTEPPDAATIAGLRGISLLIAHDLEVRRVAAESGDRQRALTAAAEERSRQIDEANRLKARFLAIAGHDLRSPIAAILGLSELLADGVLGRLSPEQQSAIEDIDRSARYLHDVIDNVLDLSKIEAGTLRLDLQSVNLGDAMAEALELLSPLARAKGIVLETRIPRDIQPLRADPTALRRVIYNLISNSIKFTHKGRISVTLEEQQEQVLFAVTDTGEGIAPDALNLIFEEYRQADRTIQERHGGTGLGLSICRSLVELHGGMIGVDSTPGQGSTFTFSIPRT